MTDAPTAINEQADVPLPCGVLMIGVGNPVRLGGISTVAHLAHWATVNVDTTVGNSVASSATASDSRGSMRYVSMSSPSVLSTTTRSGPMGRTGQLATPGSVSRVTSVVFVSDAASGVTRSSGETVLGMEVREPITRRRGARRNVGATGFNDQSDGAVSDADSIHSAFA